MAERAPPPSRSRRLPSCWTRRVLRPLSPTGAGTFASWQLPKTIVMPRMLNVKGQPRCTKKKNEGASCGVRGHGESPAGWGAGVVFATWFHGNPGACWARARGRTWSQVDARGAQQVSASAGGHGLRGQRLVGHRSCGRADRGRREMPRTALLPQARARAQRAACQCRPGALDLPAFCVTSLLD